MNCNRRNKVIKKYSDQKYKITVKDIMSQEIIFERRDLGPRQSVKIFSGLKEHFSIEGEVTSKYRNVVMFIKNEQYSIKMFKQRRKRLL